MTGAMLYDVVWNYVIDKIGSICEWLCNRNRFDTLPLNCLFFACSFSNKQYISSIKDAIFCLGLLAVMHILELCKVALSTSTWDTQMDHSKVLLHEMTSLLLFHNMWVALEGTISKDQPECEVSRERDL